MVTTLYAGLLSILFFKISLDTIRARKKYKVSLGHGPNNEILSLTSAHSNFAAYVPLLLFLLYSAEKGRAFPMVAIHALGIAITLGRALHYQAFASEKMNFRRRTVGMQLTLWSLLILALANIYVFLTSCGV